MRRGDVPRPIERAHRSAQADLELIGALSRVDRARLAQSVVGEVEAVAEVEGVVGVGARVEQAPELGAYRVCLRVGTTSGRGTVQSKLAARTVRGDRRAIRC